ncbi:hypothetical protein BCR43DRAFT_49716 [Syncephalastrum racemosum]|uniref:Zn(2)-C6 fungal-type domain-containing protein n=1 Tax=Syncephalastrum racemosum TaxID=13706 RepID=A0A1X2HV03_SYNRA|nr:hypothetical protein BCR43DRAFT_49716 [Syncephalastrum racemosum]
MTSMDIASVPVDKARRKRLKVVSACGECRRKKTKCNGEKPCTGCIKAKVECKYATSLKTKSMTPAASSTAAAAAASSSGSHSTAFRANQRHHHPDDQSSATQRAVSVEAIEDRLTVIEDILRALLKNKHQGASLPVFGSPEATHPGASCGDNSGVYHPRAVHASHAHNWHTARFGAAAGASPSQSIAAPSDAPIAPTPRRPTSAWSLPASPPASSSAFHLPPLQNHPMEQPVPQYHHHQYQQQQQQQHRQQQPSLTTSSSTSSSCSSLSSSSSTNTSWSAGPAIRNLLNDDPVTTLPTPPLTATFKLPEPAARRHSPYDYLPTTS